MSAHSYTALLTLCRHIRILRPIFAGSIVFAIIMLVALPAAISAAEFMPYPVPPPMFSHVPQKKSLIEARAGYLWGINEIRFRDGDNAIIAPERKI